MKISNLRTSWIILVSGVYTAMMAIRCIILHWLHKTTRPKVNQIIHAWAGRLLHLIGVQCVIVNPLDVAPKPGVATILMCNHCSLYDIPLCYMLYPNQSIRMLAKKEMASIPFLGSAMKALEFPFVNRRNKREAIVDLQRVQALLQEGMIIWIAPEGTRSKKGQLAPFKKGGFITAIETKATIIPIGIRGANTILPAGTLRLHLDQRAELHVGEPIEASDYTLENKEALIDRVYQSILSLSQANPHTTSVEKLRPPL